jgi:hypothetical protein
MTNSTLALLATFALFCLAGLGFVKYSSVPVTEAVVTTPPIEDPAKTKKNTPYDFASAMMKEVVPDLVYKVDSRYIHQATAAQFSEARTILDLLPAEATENIIYYQEVSVTNLDNEHEITSAGGPGFSPEQMDYLRSIDYSSNVLIRSDYIMQDEYNDVGRKSYLTYFYTVIPEREATYEGGQNALIAYLREGSAEAVKVITKDGLKPGRISFTVTETGEIAEVHMESSSGFTSVDEKLVHLVEEIPGKWEVAVNDKGEAVPQRLVFFFGLEGC